MSRSASLAEYIVHRMVARAEPHHEGEVSRQNISMYGGDGSYEESHHELFKVTPEVDTAHLAFALLSAFVVLFGMFSAFIKERLYVGEAIVAIIVGIVISPYAGDVFSPTHWGNLSATHKITLEVTRIVIALSVFAVGVELPARYMARHWKSLAILLGPVMLFGWLVAAAFIYVCVPRLDFLSALVVAACVTPTDPILAASVVGKGKFAQKHVPSHIRHLLQAESGCNDGAAFPFLYLALFLLMRGSTSVGDSIGLWIALVILYQIILGCVMGALLGVIARKVMKYAKRNGLIDRESMVAMYVALAILSTALTGLAGSDDLLSAFACGTAFAWDDWFAQATEESNFSNVIDLLSNSLAFIYLGATMPFSDWNNPDLTLTPWRLILIALAILVLRRLPVMLLFQSFCPEIKTFREAVFCGHFGPMGVGAIFIATLAVERLPTPIVPPETSLDVLSLSIQPIVYFIVLCSVVVHGLTIPVFTGGKRMHSRVHSIGRFSRSMSVRADEPSWLHRMKRVGEDVQPSPVAESPDENSMEKAEKGELEGSSTDEQEKGAGAVAEDRGEGSSQDDETVLQQEPDLEARHEHHEPDGEDTEVWQEGNQVVIDRGRGEDVEVVDINGTEEGRAPKIPSPHHPRTHLPRAAVEAAHHARAEEKHFATEAENLIERAAKRVGLQRQPSVSPHGEEGAPRKGLLRQPSMTREQKTQRDADCRRERRDNDKAGDEKTWIEGNLLIVERNAGEDVEVIDLSEVVQDKDKLDRLSSIRGQVLTSEVDESKAHFLAQGIHPTLAIVKAAKKALGIEFAQDPEKEKERGRSPGGTDRGEGTSRAGASSPGSGGRTSGEGDARRASGEDVETPRNPADGRPSDETAAPTAAGISRPQDSRTQTLRQMLFKRGMGKTNVPETTDEKVDAEAAEDVEGRGRAEEKAVTSPRSPSPSRSIRFAEDLPRRGGSRRPSPQGADRTKRP